MTTSAKMLGILTAAALALAPAAPCLGESAEASALGGASSFAQAAVRARAIVSGARAQAALNDALYEAACRGDEAAVVSLIRRGADVNAVYAPSVGNRPLDAAVIFGADVLAVARTLIKAGADVNAADFSGMTPLMYAAQYGRVQVLRLMLSEARPNPANINGALFSAVDTGGAGATRLLISARADVNARCGPNGYHATILMLAVQESGRDLGVIKALIAGHADLNARDWRGRTALMYAAAANRPDLAALLRRAGADPDLRDYAGRTAQDLARAAAQKAAAFSRWCRQNPVACQD
ncbi:MAG TPA: ankyrin repeat domain-containing protein [Elusimicrobiota bacterium]|nr:ankyrin repeat domain-containing protein [Elusimicrobiota bacterium]